MVHLATSAPSKREVHKQGVIAHDLKATMLNDGPRLCAVLSLRGGSIMDFHRQLQMCTHYGSSLAPFHRLTIPKIS